MPSKAGSRNAVGVRIADGIADAQLLALFVEQVDGERVELDQAADELGNALEQFVEIDDGRDLAAEIEQREQNVAFAQARGGRRGDGGEGVWLMRGGRRTQELYLLPA